MDPHKLVALVCLSAESCPFHYSSVFWWFTEDLNARSDTISKTVKLFGHCDMTSFFILVFLVALLKCEAAFCISDRSKCGIHHFELLVLNSCLCFQSTLKFQLLCVFN